MECAAVVKTVSAANAVFTPLFRLLIQYRSWVKCFSLAGRGGGGELGRAKLRGSGELKPLKLFEIFIPEIAANASNFKN